SSPYITSKHAVAGLTRTAAIEYAARNIRINAVCPGIIETPLMAKTPGASEHRAEYAALHPIGRFGQVEEVARAVLWLASEEASFTVGTLMTVDGGWTAA